MQRGYQIRLAEAGDISGPRGHRGSGRDTGTLGLLEKGAVETTLWKGIGGGRWKEISVALGLGKDSRKKQSR